VISTRNFEALSAVLADIRHLGIGSMICLGDIVGYASGARACLKAVNALGCPSILGNHDEAVAFDSTPLTNLNDTALAGILLARGRLNPTEKSFLAEQPRDLVIDAAHRGMEHAKIIETIGPVGETSTMFKFRLASVEIETGNARNAIPLLTDVFRSWPGDAAAYSRLDSATSAERSWRDFFPGAKIQMNQPKPHGQWIDDFRSET